MRTQRKKIGYKKYLDYETMSMVIEPKYKYEINLSLFLRFFISLFTNPKFYYSIIFPIITMFFVIISHNKVQIFVFSAFFGLCLLPLHKTIKEVFKSLFYAN